MSDNMFSWVLGVFFGFMLGIALCALTDYDSDTWREGISRGYAEYCPQDNQFAWKGECK